MQLGPGWLGSPHRPMSEEAGQLTTHMLLRCWKSAILVALMVVVPVCASTISPRYDASASAMSLQPRPAVARGTLVVRVEVTGGLIPEGPPMGTVDHHPGLGAHITVTGPGKTLHLRSDRRGIAKAMLRPGRYKVSRPSSGAYRTDPQTAVMRARKTTTVRLYTSCFTC